MTNEEHEETPAQADPNEIVLARRVEGWHPVSIDINELVARRPSWEPTEEQALTGLIWGGDVIPMRRGEAEGRVDFEVVDQEEA